MGPAVFLWGAPIGLFRMIQLLDLSLPTSGPGVPPLGLPCALTAGRSIIVAAHPGQSYSDVLAQSIRWGTPLSIVREGAPGPASQSHLAPEAA